MHSARRASLARRKRANRYVPVFDKFGRHNFVVIKTVMGCKMRAIIIAGLLALSENFCDGESMREA